MQTFHNYPQLHHTWVGRIPGLQMVKGVLSSSICAKDAVIIKTFILEVFLLHYKNLAGANFNIEEIDRREINNVGN